MVLGTLSVDSGSTTSGQLYNHLEYHYKVHQHQRCRGSVLLVRAALTVVVGRPRIRQMNGMPIPYSRAGIIPCP